MADLELRNEQVLVERENTTMVAVAPTGHALVRNADGFRTFDPDGRLLGGPVDLGFVMAMDWDARGTSIAFVAPNDLEVVAADLTGRRSLPADGFGTPGFSLEPGGARVAYHQSTSPDGDHAVWVRPTGDGPSTLLADPGAGPAWSPTGDRITYVITPWPGSERAATEVRAVTPDGAGTVRLASLAPGLTAGNLRWSPDGLGLVVDVIG
jgi:hypothetical protein